jgi:hypothetical protein
MNNYLVFGLPLAILLFLILFGGSLFAWQAHSTADKTKDTKDHSERIYKDFEMYLKVVLGLAAAFGYIRFEKFPEKAELARQGLQVVGAISLLVMATFCIFIICHQGSKIRRWEHIEWGKAVFWQELWACLAMWVFSSGIWAAAFVW